MSASRPAEAQGAAHLLGEWARLLLSTLRDAGVRDLWVSPGSRSTPFTWAALHTEGLTLRSVVDERSAAFLALGHTRVTGRPCALLCTSGTAAANYFPAVVEASQSHLPLVVLTADRPLEVQHAAAPQTIDQIKLYGDFARRFYDLGLPDPAPSALVGLRRSVAQAVAESLGPLPGPVHLNLRARKPLEPSPASNDTERALSAQVSNLIARPIARHAPSTGLANEAIHAAARTLSGAASGIIAVGPLPAFAKNLAEPIAELSHLTGFPIFAEAASQVRFALADHELSFPLFDWLLSAPHIAEKLRPEVLLCLGHTPTSSAFERWAATIPHRIVLAEHGLPDALGNASLAASGNLADGLLSLINHLQKAGSAGASALAGSVGASALAGSVGASALAGSVGAFALAGSVGASALAGSALTAPVARPAAPPPPHPTDITSTYPSRADRVVHNPAVSLTSFAGGPQAQRPEPIRSSASREPGAARASEHGARILDTSTYPSREAEGGNGAGLVEAVDANELVEAVKDAHGLLEAVKDAHGLLEAVKDAHGLLEAVKDAHESCRRAVAEALEGATGGLAEGAAVQGVVEALPQGGVLVLGNSLPIRDVDAYVTRAARVHVVSQRGVSGIDGLVSGAIGSAIGCGAPTLLLVGDVSLLHDLGGLASAGFVTTPLVIAVIDNAGGRIFDQLPVQKLYGGEPEAARLWLTPPPPELSHAAALFGLKYAAPQGVEAIREATVTALAKPGVTLLHLRVTPESAAKVRQRVLEALASET